MTCASPSLRPAYLAGSRRASMHVRMANRRAGGSARSPFVSNDATYCSLAERISGRTDMGFTSLVVGIAGSVRGDGVANRRKVEMPAQRVVLVLGPEDAAVLQLG